MSPTPTLPQYSGANVRGIVPALLAPRGGSRPAWIPSAAAAAEQVVLLVIDGLGWEQLQQRRHLAPNLAALSGGSITSVVPSTTATALTSITTGLTPGEHGVVGYRMEMSGEVLNVLRWSAGHGDSRRQIIPAATQPFQPFLGERIAVVSKAELEQSAFSEAHLRGCEPAGWRAASSMPVIIKSLLARGDRLVALHQASLPRRCPGRRRAVVLPGTRTGDRTAGLHDGHGDRESGRWVVPIIAQTAARRA